MTDEEAIAFLERVAAGYATNIGRTHASFAMSLFRSRISFAIQIGVACQLASCCANLLLIG
jgi:hypothetical protein